jgi:molecular chaperone GrpE
MNGNKDSSAELTRDFQVIDKRHFTGPDGALAGETSSGAPVQEKPRYPTFVEELMGKVAEMEKRFAQKKGELETELAKTRLRLETDYERRIQLEKQKMMLPFLEVLDNLDLALQSATGASGCERLVEGVEMTRSLFMAKLQAQGVTAIQVLDQPFDPRNSEAIGTVAVADEARDGLVLEELKRGYQAGEQLVRPAQVRVGRFVAGTPVTG